MAGVFGDDINDRDGFLRLLEHTRALHARLPINHRDDAVMVKVGEQLESIASWTKDGGTPSRSARATIVMGQLVSRGYENTLDREILALRDHLVDLTNYLRYWPSDDIAANDDNFDYVLNYDEVGYDE